jgi:hypothetical protein
VTVSRRIDRSWTVLTSLEDGYGERCVDLFRRPDDSFGFEEFRRDVEDSGAWTPVAYYSSARFDSKQDALRAAANAVPWLRDHPAAKRLSPSDEAEPGG